MPAAIRIRRIRAFVRFYPAQFGTSEPIERHSSAALVAIPLDPSGTFRALARTRFHSIPKPRMPAVVANPLAIGAALLRSPNGASANEV